MSMMQLHYFNLSHWAHARAQWVWTNLRQMMAGDLVQHHRYQG